MSLMLAAVGWQELISLGVVAFAVLVLLRRLNSSGTGDCGSGCSGGSCGGGDPERQPTVRTLHEIKVSQPQAKGPSEAARQEESERESASNDLSAHDDPDPLRR